MLRFVKDTEKESHHVVKRYDDLQKIRAKRPEYKEVTIPNLVATGYTTFVAAQKKLEKGRGQRKNGRLQRKLHRP